MFWRTLHGGRSDGIGAALAIQTAAYLENPNDAVTAARAGWLHIWRLAESSGLASIPATITNDAVLARRYFEEAVALAPDDARYVGSLGSVLRTEGAIHKDEALTRRGDCTLRNGIDAWHAPDYATWALRDVLEARIRDAPADVAAFAADRGRGTSATPMMFTSSFACSACHMK